MSASRMCGRFRLPLPALLAGSFEHVATAVATRLSDLRASASGPDSLARQELAETARTMARAAASERCSASLATARMQR